MKRYLLLIIFLFVSFWSFGQVEVQFLDPTPEPGVRTDYTWLKRFSWQLLNYTYSPEVINQHVVKIVKVNEGQTPQDALLENELSFSDTATTSHTSISDLETYYARYQLHERYAYQVSVYNEDWSQLIAESPVYTFRYRWLLHAFKSYGYMVNIDTLYNKNPDDLQGMGELEYRDFTIPLPLGNGLEVYDPMGNEKWFIKRGMVKGELPQADTITMALENKLVEVSIDSIKLHRHGLFARADIRMKNNFYDLGATAPYYYNLPSFGYENGQRWVELDAHNYKVKGEAYLADKDSFSLAGTNWEVAVNNLSVEFDNFVDSYDDYIKVSNQTDFYLPLPRTPDSIAYHKFHTQADYFGEELYVDSAAAFPVYYAMSDSSLALQVQNFALDFTDTLSDGGLPAEWKGVYAKAMTINYTSQNEVLNSDWSLLADDTNSTAYFDENGLQLEFAHEFTEQSMFAQNAHFDGQWDSLHLKIVNGEITQKRVYGHLMTSPETLMIESPQVYMDLGEEKLMLVDYNGQSEPIPFAINIDSVTFDSFRFHFLNPENQQYALELAYDEAFTKPVAGYEELSTDVYFDETNQVSYFQVDSVESDTNFFARLHIMEEETFAPTAFVFEVSTEANNGPAQPVFAGGEYVYKDKAITLKWNVSGYNTLTKVFVQRASSEDAEFQTISTLNLSSSLASYADSDLTDHVSYTYRLVVYNKTGYVVSEPSEAFQKELVLGSKEQKSQKVELYPNPVAGKLTLRGLQAGEQVTAELLSINGEIIALRSFLATDESSLNLKEVPAGVYFLRITSGKETNVYKLIKE